MFTEKLMEDFICADPEKYLNETGLKLLARQYRIGSYVFDMLFEDRHGGKLIVELQKGTLDRIHAYKIIDYYDEYKEKKSQRFCRANGDRQHHSTGKTTEIKLIWDYVEGDSSKCVY